MSAATTGATIRIGQLASAIRASLTMANDAVRATAPGAQPPFVVTELRLSIPCLAEESADRVGLVGLGTDGLLGQTRRLVVQIAQPASGGPPTTVTSLKPGAEGPTQDE